MYIFTHSIFLSVKNKLLRCICKKCTVLFMFRPWAFGQCPLPSLGSIEPIRWFPFVSRANLRGMQMKKVAKANLIVSDGYSVVEFSKHNIL